MAQSTLVAQPEVRFKFGENWSRFLSLINESRIREAEKSLLQMLGLTTLSGKTFLDIGCGSGLFSLAAARLGARVRSFDYDAQSVACTRELNKLFFPQSETWQIEQGSILDDAYVNTLGSYEIVYSWGVLHHTGALWKAVENALRRVKPQGCLFIALYNDQGLWSKGWRLVKRIYNQLPAPLQPVWAAVFGIRLWGPTLLKDLFKGRPFDTWKNYASRRGMSPWRDVVDWVGGLPFEVATPEAVRDFCEGRGFRLLRLKVDGGHGCNEFIFEKRSAG